MRCPRCGDDFEDGVLVCPDDAVPLVPPGAVQAADPVVDAVLGRFAPAPATFVVGMLRHRGVAHEASVAEDGTILVLVDETDRDALRAELVAKWSQLLAALPPDERMAVHHGPGTPRLPGWADPPEDAWIDWEGRLRVVDADQDRFDDSTRVVGPSLATIGVVLLVFGWYADAGPGVLLGGLLALLVGVFVPR